MNVRIAYAVDLDDVPLKVQEILHAIKSPKAIRLVSLAAELLELGHCDMCCTLLDEARKTLAQMDGSLSEAQMILEGYKGAKKEPEPEAANPIEAPGEADAD